MVNFTKQNDLIIKEKFIMTQRDIEIMDVIVDKMIEGATLSQALKEVYVVRNVRIPYNKENFNISIQALKMSCRSTNGLLRAGMRTLGDVIDYCNKHKITDVANLGKGSGLEVLETILDYCWNKMTTKERAEFLIDTVERNSINVRI
jgi:DNA-directed RNA polymerase alpha subunit